MSKYVVMRENDEYIAKLGNLEFASEELVGRAIYKGAAIVADAIKANINSLPKSVCSQVEKEGLAKGFGLAKKTMTGDFINVKAGFDGYNTHITAKYPKGHPNVMIARSIEGGTSFRQKHPFVGPAVRATRAKAQQAMQEEIDKEVKRIMG